MTDFQRLRQEGDEPRKVARLVNAALDKLRAVADASWTFLAAPTAENVTFTPAGNVAATDVQAAIEEVDSEKLALTGGTLSGALTIGSTSAALGALVQTDAGAVQGPLFDLRRTSASPAAADRMGGIRFQGQNTAAANVNYIIQRAVLNDPTSGSEDASLEWLSYVAGASAARMTLGAGLWMAGATGGDQGAGTFNGTGVYDDGVLLTCYVGDVIDATSGAAGQIDDATKAALIAKWDAKVPDQVFPGGEDAEGKKLSGRVVRRQHFGARKFLARLGTEYDPRTIEGAMKHLRDKGHLTSLPNPAKWVHGSMSIGDWIQRLTEAAELCAVWAWQERQARKALEARVAALESALPG